MDGIIDLAGTVTWTNIQASYCFSAKSFDKYETALGYRWYMKIWPSNVI